MAYTGLGKYFYKHIDKPMVAKTCNCGPCLGPYVSDTGLETHRPQERSKKKPDRLHEGRALDGT